MFTDLYLQVTLRSVPSLQTSIYRSPLWVRKSGQLGEFTDLSLQIPHARSSLFSIFKVKLGHFTINEIFLYVTNMQAYQQKTEKFFVSQEKIYIGSATGTKFTNISLQIFTYRVDGKKHTKKQFTADVLKNQDRSIDE